MEAIGVVSGRWVRVSDPVQAERLHSRGFGNLKAGALLLSGSEALFLMEAGRLRMDSGIAMAALLATLSREDASLPARWSVYRDLRSRGIAARPGPPGSDFIVPQRSAEQGGGAESLVTALAESDRLDFARLKGSIAAARRARKRVLLGVTDGEGETTWYRVEEVDVTGTVKDDPAAGSSPARAVLVGNRAIVEDPASVENLEKTGHYGRRVGPLLHLSLVETGFLLSKGRVTVTDTHGNELSEAGLSQVAGRFEKEFDHLLNVYSLLRARRLAPKSGFKFGAHFRAYRRHPDEEHAQYLVHVVAPSDEPTWAEVARAVRLAHGVKKDMVFGDIGAGGEVRFFRVQRVKI